MYTIAKNEHIVMCTWTVWNRCQLCAELKLSSGTRIWNKCWTAIKTTSSLKLWRELLELVIYCFYALMCVFVLTDFEDSYPLYLH